MLLQDSLRESSKGPFPDVCPFLPVWGKNSPGARTAVRRLVYLETTAVRAKNAETRVCNFYPTGIFRSQLRYWRHRKRPPAFFSQGHSIASYSGMFNPEGHTPFPGRALRIYLRSVRHRGSRGSFLSPLTQRLHHKKVCRVCGSPWPRQHPPQR